MVFFLFADKTSTKKARISPEEDLSQEEEDLLSTEDPAIVTSQVGANISNHYDDSLPAEDLEGEESSIDPASSQLESAGDDSSQLSSLDSIEIDDSSLDDSSRLESENEESSVTQTLSVECEIASDVDQHKPDEDSTSMKPVESSENLLTPVTTPENG